MHGSIADVYDNDYPLTDNYHYYGDYDGGFDYARASVVPWVAFLLTYDVIGALGLVGNVMILVVLSHKSLSSTSYSVYLRFLAVGDSSELIFRLLENNLDHFDLFHPLLTKNSGLCRLYHVLDKWSTYLSPWMVVMLTADRFLAVMFPLKRATIVTKRRAVYACLAACAFTALLDTPNIFFFDIIVYPDGVFCTMKDGNDRFNLAMLTFTSFVPCILIFVLNSFTLRGIRVSARRRAEMTHGAVSRLATGEGGKQGVTGRVAVAVVTSPSGENSNQERSTSENSSGITKMDSEVEGSKSQQSLDVSVSDSDSKVSENRLNVSVVSDGKTDDVAPKKRNVTDADGGYEGANRFDNATDSEKKAAGKFDGQNEDDVKTDTRAHVSQTAEEPRKTKDKLIKVEKKTGENRAKNTAKQTNTKKTSGVDRATVSLLYLSFSAFLTIAPYSLMIGIFHVWMMEYYPLLDEDPMAEVPMKIQNLVRVWDILEILYALNFAQNFYILLATNKQIKTVTKERLGDDKAKDLS
nr:hypothetical protein BaRGS_000920 [Batillaria attramentaria]